ncbi:MAG: hypothetical protein WCI77_07485 [Candidatus Omnitrophota bacterium]
MRRKSVALVGVFLLVVSFLCPIQSFCDELDLNGKVVTLKTRQGKQPVYIGINKKMFNHLTSCRIAEAEPSYQVLMLSRDGFEVENCTLARVLETNFWEKTAKVKILTGGYEGMTGWVLLTNIAGS